MTIPQPSEKDTTSRLWILKTLGLAFGLAIVLVALVGAVVIGLESPSNRPAAASAAPIAADPAGSFASNASAGDAPMAAPGPTETLAASPTPEATATPEATPTLVPSPTATAAATATPEPTQTLPAVRSSTAARSSGQSTVLKPRATPAPILPLDMSFYIKAYCHKSTDNLQVVDLFLTAHGGVPPYDYYNDTTFIGHDSGMLRFTMKASSGNPVPYKIIILDSRGQRYMNEFFYKTGVSCKASPE